MKTINALTKNRTTLFFGFIIISTMTSWLSWRVYADSITLTTGEIVEGTIVSETSTNIEIELKRYKGVSRVFEKSQIKLGSIQKNQSIAAKPANSLSPNTQSQLAQESRTPFSFTGNAFDFVVWLSKIRNSAVSIDPNIVGELAKADVQILEPTTIPTLEILESQLKPIGLIVKMVSLAPNLTVSFITSPPAWAYYNAISCTKTGDLRSAVTLLTAVNADSSEFGEHCTGLIAVLDKVFQRNREVLQIESQVQQAIAKYKSTIASADASTAMGNFHSTMDPKSSAPQLAQARAAQLLKDAQTEFDRVYHGLDKDYAKVVLDNGILARRFREAEMAHLVSEANFILNNLVTIMTRFQNLVDQTSDVTKAFTTHEFDKKTGEIGDLRSDYIRTGTAIEGAIRSAVGILPLNPERADRTFSEAYSIDRSSLLACVGCGYCKVLKQIKGLDTLANIPSTPTGTSLMQMYSREFRNQQRYHLLQVLEVLNSAITNQTAIIKSGKIGTTEGLAVKLGEGNLFGISVTIGPQTRHTPGIPAAKTGYWAQLTEQLREAELTDEPIEFGDYGTKDSYLIVSAIQAYKWIKSVDEISEMEKNKNGLKIEFHQLFGGKGGDSAGVTFAVSAFSALKQVEVRQEVAMTGSIRADGSVKAVGGVPEKISGACHESGIETIIVPFENRRDLLAVPADQLCRVAIITANDIRDYLRQATFATKNEAIADKFEVQTTLTRLRLAQVLLLLGERTVAREILESISRDHPEVFNAGRLVELLDKTASPNFPKVEKIIDREDVDRIVHQLNPPPLLPPGQFTVIPGVKSIALAWSPSPDAAAYVVKRVGDSTVYVVNETNYTDTGLSPNVNYCYTVVASNRLGCSVPSLQKCATTQSPPAVQPIAQPDVPPEVPPEVPLWKKYWYVIAIVVIGGGYYLFRSPR